MGYDTLVYSMMITPQSCIRKCISTVIDSNTEINLMQPYNYDLVHTVYYERGELNYCMKNFLRGSSHDEL